MNELLNNKVIEKGGGHNMAAGFSMKKNKLNNLIDFILQDFEAQKQKFKLK
jgi:single-stranded-DNA-specific exonuclease